MKEVLTWYKEKRFSVRISRQWNRLHRGTVQSPSLEGFKTWQDKALSNLTWPHSRDCFEQGFGLKSSWSVFLLWIILWFYIELNIAGLTVVDLNKARYVRNLPMPLGPEKKPSDSTEDSWWCRESNVCLPPALYFPLQLSNVLGSLQLNSRSTEETYKYYINMVIAQ